jgi:hypothetical protein
VPEVQRYVVELETRVVVKSVLLSGGELPVGEYVVRSAVGSRITTSEPERIPAMVQQGMERNAKQASIMAAGVDNTERNRLK